VVFRQTVPSGRFYDLTDLQLHDHNDFESFPFMSTSIPARISEPRPKHPGLNSESFPFMLGVLRVQLQPEPQPKFDLKHLARGPATLRAARRPKFRLFKPVFWEINLSF
jgi:hypothetical protein